MPLTIETVTTISDLVCKTLFGKALPPGLPEGVPLAQAGWNQALGRDVIGPDVPGRCAPRPAGLLTAGCVAGG
jgi:hypothetical protein